MSAFNHTLRAPIGVLLALLSCHVTAAPSNPTADAPLAGGKGASSTAPGKQKKTGVTGDAAKGGVTPTMKSMIPGSSGQDADRAWASLMDQLSSTPTLPLIGRRNVEPREISYSERLHKASLAARNFYTKFPKDARVDEARKHEVVADLHAVQFGANRFQSDAVARAAAFRSDKKNPVTHRFDVAIAMETFDLNNQLHGNALQDHDDVQQTLIDKLYSEFGDIDQIHGMYIALMRNTDSARAQQIASGLMKKNPPAWAKAQAQAVIDRAALIGRPASISLTPISGKALAASSSAEKAKPTVIYFWDRKDQSYDINMLRAAAKALSREANWIYIGLNVSASKDADLSGIAPIPGEYCFEPAGLKSPSAVSFHVTQAPWVCVLSSNGMLVGSGNVKELSSFLNAAQ